MDAGAARSDSDEGEESDRPKYRPYFQQTMRSWSPLLTPWKAIVVYLLLGFLFVSLGSFLYVQSADTIEFRYQYDGDGSDGEECKITSYKEGKECTISMTANEDMSGPVYVYYELNSFYQNHATYVDSVYDDQLQGSISTSSIDDCSPLEYNGSRVLHPCGLIANTYFNDIIELTSGAEMNENGIAWKSDIEAKFSQPEGFVYSECEDSTVSCAECLQDAGLSSSASDDFDGCGTYVDDNVTFAYWYPDEDSTQYLYETFPEVISPITGVENEHFIVWMRTSGLSEFRKLYGIIENGVSAGDEITFTITANFIVDFYDGTKALVVSTTNSTGGRNRYWGQSLLTIGICILVLAVLGALKQCLSPREMGDISKLMDDE